MFFQSDSFLQSPVLTWLPFLPIPRNHQLQEHEVSLLQGAQLRVSTEYPLLPEMAASSWTWGCSILRSGSQVLDDMALLLSPTPS